MFEWASKLASWLLGPPKTRAYKPLPFNLFQRPRDLPPFTFNTIRAMLLEPTCRIGLTMRTAPLWGVEWSHQVGGQWVPGFAASHPRVGEYALRQVKTIWKYLNKIMSCGTWGWSAGEVMWCLDRDKTLSVDCLLERKAEDVMPLETDGRVSGVRFLRLGDTRLGHIDLPLSKAYWMAHDREAEYAYGRSALIGCYDPWADKHLNGGAKDVRRLFMHKDAYGGADIGYPEGSIDIDGKGDVPNRDIAREMVEQMAAGSVVTHPIQYDAQGRELWTVKRAVVPANPTHILQYPKDLDVEILRGLEVPDDLLISGATGAWEGKRVPMTIYYTNADRMLVDALTQVVVPLVNFGIRANFGPGQWATITHKPLVTLVAGEKLDIQAGAPKNSSPNVGMPAGAAPGGPARMALRGAKKMIAMEAMKAPKGGITIGGKFYTGGQFIPSEVLEQASPRDRQKLQAGHSFDRGHAELSQKDRRRLDAWAAGKSSIDPTPMLNQLASAKIEYVGMAWRGATGVTDEQIAAMVPGAQIDITSPITATRSQSKAKADMAKMSGDKSGKTVSFFFRLKTGIPLSAGKHGFGEPSHGAVAIPAGRSFTIKSVVVDKVNGNNVTRVRLTEV